MVCMKCLTEKDIEYFTNNRKICKKCHADYMREYRKKNIEKFIIYEKLKREKHKEKISEQKKRCYINNREYYIKKAIEYEKNNKEARIRYRKEYYSREDIKKREYSNFVKRIKDKNAFRFRMRMSRVLYRALKSQNAKKMKTTIQYLNCSIEYFLKHIEQQFSNGMTWENYGKWHLDHIIPIASFDLSNEEEKEKCFNYKNLQPLWARDNQIKGARLNANR